MFDGLQYFGAGLLAFANLDSLFNVAWATLLGIVVGMTPGLTATLGIALMTTLTFKMAPGDAILILICMYVGAIYGGSRSAILLNIPGTPANAATTLDGYPLARRGEAGKAMGIATSGSVLGTIVGMMLLATIAPTLAEFALKFGAFEFFWLAVFGVLISGQLTSFNDPLKGWIAGILGLLAAMVGQEGIHAYQRFTFGYLQLAGGLGLLPALIGAFGFAEILIVMTNPSHEVIKSRVGSVIPKIREVFVYWRTIIRSGVIGTVMGIVPGVGEDMGAWASYAASRRASKEKDLYGTGSIEGLMAAETGNSAAVPGAIIPVLTLAVPGSAPAAVLLAAMFIHGIRPGPLIMIETPGFIFEVVAMVFYASIAILFYGFLLTRPLLLVLRVSRERLMPIIFVLCTIGAFAIAARVFDVWVMLFFGVVGYAMRRMDYPMAPLVLGLVLGDILDKSLRRGLVLTDGDLTAFFVRPISAVIWIGCLIVVLYSVPFLRNRIGRMVGRIMPGPKRPN
ncbi:Tripartite tricarboxylate transporter TctA family [hydrothermal vent metagenome]|uniref:Tripartite tricarboxylate transporter TctA family n=1 Tax=hydrothermal vent metagenome TaxID=652676 RepID=A0A3B0TTK0_9ZZZZ